mgnify:CR=1 FL=1
MKPLFNTLAHKLLAAAGLSAVRLHQTYEADRGATMRRRNVDLVIDVGATLQAGAFGIDGIFSLDVDFRLKMNTRGGTGRDQYDLGIQRGYSRVSFAGKMNKQRC